MERQQLVYNLTRDIFTENMMEIITNIYDTDETVKLATDTFQCMKKNIRVCRWKITDFCICARTEILEIIRQRYALHHSPCNPVFKLYSDTLLANILSENNNITLYSLCTICNMYISDYCKIYLNGLPNLRILLTFEILQEISKYIIQSYGTR